MPGNPSFYFTLFKKFQVVNHVQSATYHGAATPAGGFNLLDPNAANGVFGTSLRGHPLTAGDPNPANNPLWAVLNSAAGGTPGFTLITIPGGAQAGSQWPTMPPSSTLGWTNFQINAPAPKLVDVFGTWIGQGQVNDTPAGVISQKPPTPIPGPLDPGFSVFVCSYGQDAGKRPDPMFPVNNYWATSLIFLLDSSGNIQNPQTLSAAAEWYLVAIIGNRGANQGNYLSATGIQTSAVVMVWNTQDSPGVELPALSNLDVNDTNPIFEQYFLNSGAYDVVGFRLNVQTVYDGIIAALNQAVVMGQINLGGLTPDQWVHQQNAHLCAKVLVRPQGGSFPLVGDLPQNNAALAQKNLAPFDINVQDTMVPNIVWKNFITGTPFFFRLPGAGRSRLTLEVPPLPEGAFKFYIGIPTEVFGRVFRQGKDGSVKGFRVLSPKELCESNLGNKAKPFPDAVVLQYEGQANVLEFPALPEKCYLAMSLGIEYNAKKIKPGPLGEITLVHRADLPRLVAGTRCFEIEETIAGGFTLVLRAFDPFAGPKGHKVGL